jgi:hypothetical protein
MNPVYLFIRSTKSSFFSFLFLGEIYCLHVNWQQYNFTCTFYMLWNCEHVVFVFVKNYLKTLSLGASPSKLA